MKSHHEKTWIREIWRSAWSAVGCILIFYRRKNSFWDQDFNPDEFVFYLLYHLEHRFPKFFHEEMDGKFHVDLNGSLRTITWKDDDIYIYIYMHVLFSQCQRKLTSTSVRHYLFTWLSYWKRKSMKILTIIRWIKVLNLNFK